PLLTCTPPPSWLSVGERPPLEVRLQPQPDRGETARLEDEEPDDQQPEDRLVQGEDCDEAVVTGTGRDAGDRAAVLLDQARERADEQRPEDRAEDGPQPADDDDR